MSQCSAATWDGVQCSRVGKIELMAEREDGSRCLVALCVHHHRLALKNRGRGLFNEGVLWYQPKPHRPGLPWIEADLPETEDDDASKE